MEIQFVDLKRQYASIKGEIDEAIQRVVDSQYFILGEEVAKFEEEFARYLGTKRVVAVGSGSDALLVAIEALNLKGEVISVANTFISSIDCITHNRLKPVLVDVEEDSYNIDPEKIKITPKTSAILPVHLYGQFCDIKSVMDAAGELPVIEDACQAHGAEINGKKAGTFGRISCFSFYPGKNLGAYGDAGAIATDDEKLADRISFMRNYGSSKKYHHDFIAYNKRMDAIQAAVLRVKLKYLDKWNEQRRSAAKLYTKLLDGIVHTPKEVYGKHVYHLYVIRTDKRDELQEYLSSKGIHCQIHYPIPVHMTDAYKPMNLGKFPITERNAKQILSLPMFPGITDDEIRYISEEIKNFVSKK
jgi:dTDP-4-amino-4,6-dideoxygalactose transaminase